MRAALALLIAVPAFGAEPWTLDSAVATALQDSPDVRIARARMEAAEAVVGQADAAWMPELSVSSRYTETNSPMAAFGAILNERAFNFGLDFNQPGRIDDFEAGGMVAYNLYSGGEASAERAAALAGTRAAALDEQEARNALVAEVVNADLDLRKVREAVRALESGVEAYRAAVGVARARFAAGQMLKADVLSLEVKLAETRESLFSAEHGAELAARAFQVALGVPPDEGPVRLADQDPALARLAPPDTRDYSRRPELAALAARVRAAEAMVEAAQSGRLPAVNAFGAYQFDQGWVLNHHGDSWTGGISVDLRVFDGGRTGGRIRQAKAELDEAREALRKATLEAGLDAEQARLAHDDAAARLAVSRQAVEEAEESAALSRARFGKGALLTAELIGAESRLLEARLRRTVAEADERMALVELRRSLGLDPLPSVISSPP